MASQFYAALVLTSGALLARVWIGLYAALLAWLARSYARFAIRPAVCARREWRADAHRWQKTVAVGDAAAATAWRVCLGLYLFPVLAVVIPLLIVAGAFALPVAVIRIG